MVLVVGPVSTVGQQEAHVSNSGKAFSKVLTHANTAFRWLGIDCNYSSNYLNFCFMRRHCSSLSAFLVVVFMPRADKGNSHLLSGLPLLQLYLHFSPCKERIGSSGTLTVCLEPKGNTVKSLCRIAGDHTGEWMFYVSVAFGHCREGN